MELAEVILVWNGFTHSELCISYSLATYFLLANTSFNIRLLSPLSHGLLMLNRYGREATTKKKKCSQSSILHLVGSYTLPLLLSQPKPNSWPLHRKKWKPNTGDVRAGVGSSQSLLFLTQAPQQAPFSNEAGLLDHELNTLTEEDTPWLWLAGKTPQTGCGLRSQSLSETLGKTLTHQDTTKCPARVKSVMP